LVTYHGRAIARITPTQDPSETVTPQQWLEAWNELGKEVTAAWPPDVSAVAAVREQRRDLP